MVESNNEDIYCHIKQGDAYKETGSIDFAISEYQKALKIEHNNVEALLKLGGAYEIKGDREKETAFYILAQNTYEKAITIEPDNPKTHDSLISLGIKRGNIDELVKQYKEKLNKYPDNQVIIEVVKRLTTISLLSIPPQISGKEDKKGCAKIFLDYVFPFMGIIPLLLSIMVPKLKALESLGIMIVVSYLIYKLLSTKKPGKSRRKW